MDHFGNESYDPDADTYTEDALGPSALKEGYEEHPGYFLHVPNQTPPGLGLEFEEPIRAENASSRRSLMSWKRRDNASGSTGRAV